MSDALTVFPFLAVLSLAAATLVSEDLTCVAAGVLVAEGTLSWPAAIAGCLAGIVAGDVMLMLTGRLLGRRAIESRWLRHIVTADAVDRAEEWMRERGGAVVFVSRFLPGTRLATYLAAGLLNMSLPRFTLNAMLSALVWVPGLVGLAAAGGKALESRLVASAGTIPRLLLIVAIVTAAMTLTKIRPAGLWRASRRLYGLQQRLWRWEFWPAWIFYPPVIAYILRLAVKHRSATLFTAANPGILAGGFVGESKFDILRHLSRNDDVVARTALIGGGLTVDERAAMATAFIDRAGLTFPVVLKPDQGQRGSGVTIVHTEAELRAHFERAPLDLLVQEYVPGVEFGVFYHRPPGAAHGRIFSITAKQFPSLIGDGATTLADLILADSRAVCMERVHRRRHAAHLDWVPARGEIVALVELGSHCRGSLFRDASHLASPALVRAIDAAAQRFDGFHFGRFDVRAASIDEFVAGSFRIIELNGVTSEATHIYDPKTTLMGAYRILAGQWQIAFAIGAANRRRGAVPATIGELASLALRYRRIARMHPAQVEP
jgi:membrane protein DedA with SNARE-associated domain